MSAPRSTLPNVKTGRQTSLRDLSVLLYGASKIGKSTFASQAEGCLFLATEPGLNALDTYQVPITSWAELLEACRAVEQDDHSFGLVALDTIDNAYRLVVEHFRRKLNIAHESDLGFGKAYSLINGEFHRVLTRLAFQPLGLLLISHSEEREIATRTGKRHRIVPTLPEKARRIVLDLVDVVAFCDLEEEPGKDGKPEYRRVIRTRPNPRFEAGDRTGLLPPVLDLNFHTFLAALEKPRAGDTELREDRKRTDRRTENVGSD